ncbi:MAG: septum formation initiator family protein [Thermoanaerobacteraceae bacterium]|nr:septum formation initiator family protein [Thermoanaerobacteraceae bacterium]
MKKLFKKVLIIAIVIYASITLINQQLTIMHMEAKKAELNDQIQEAKDETKRLNEKLKNASSDAYIEQIAREKLGLVKDGDIIYVDVGKSGDPSKGAGK